MIIKKTLSSKETVNLGKRFSQFLKDKDVVLLEGSLGGGKTTFIQGVLKGLGYRKSVLSPSYTLIREYKTKTFFTYHLDLYRLDVGDLFDLGLNEIICSDNSLVLIEWGHKIEDEL
ncbi:MAG: tRNA (adenosine(37)-N6)-threonylcarbamoyltransferase complex ATPase subunit type 1 TsaE, partial [Candidatus Omnitrophica bacterium]|nr:tRNA (adenosine(37)-N6)-threonylcarbamoyltransferase complex ATPase subunit type 1 TsaE [Candidatus Omnitrophota bacterium]